ncbi:Hypothetical protein GbCGDNIH6_1629a [Granulibacter bethesdensis]|nr:Hypothetical protein GbCGDNIH6_1629a [Granulibacter bethesdensis]
MRGGTAIAVPWRFPQDGLSPRARRNRPMGDPLFSPCGSISACAEEPGDPRPLGCWPRVYLRVRGGTCEFRRPQRAAGGLSPRARRNHTELRLRTATNGSISACAEEPSPRAHGSAGQ